MNMDTHVYLTAYGANGVDQGIIELIMDENNGTIKNCFKLNGKSNMVIETENLLITSVQEAEGNYLLFFTLNGSLLERIKTEYFYSYGTLSNGYLLLASFDEGLDSSYHLTTHEWSTNIHKKKGIDRKGRSHFIKKINNKIISVENVYQQIYIYENESLRDFKIIQFEENLNIRLISLDESKGLLFLNTELTNELLILRTEDFSIIDRVKMTDRSNCFSGGNVYSVENGYICITMRGENAIYIYYNNENYSLAKKILCKRMPRDLKVIDNLLYVTCSDDQCIEVYNLKTFQKVNEIEVQQPVTFSI